MNIALKALRRYGWLVAVVAITITWSLLLIGDPIPSLRGPAGRRWPYEPANSARRLLTAGLVFLVYLVVATRLVRRVARLDDRSGRLWIYVSIAWAIFGTPLIQCAVIYLRHPNVLQELFDRTASLHSGGYFSAVANVENVQAYLRHFPELMPDFPIHPKRHPPGIPLMFWLTRQAFSLAPRCSRQAAWVLRRYQCDNLWLQYLSNPQIASAWISIVLPALAGLTVLPLYRLGRQVLDRPKALFTVLLYPLIPSMGLFATMWDQFIPLFTTLGLLGLMQGLEKRRLDLLIAAGAAISLSTFFSLGTTMGLAVLGLYGLFWHLSRQPVKVGHMIADGTAFAVGLVSVWVIYWILWRVSVLQIWDVAMSFHFDMKDTYLASFFHLYDFLAFLGIPLACLLIRSAWLALRSPRKKPANLLSLAFALGLLVIDLSGSSKGEVARVWIFLIPWALVVSVWATTPQASNLPDRQTRGDRPGRLGSLFLILLAIQTFSAAANLHVIHTRYDEPSRPTSVRHELPPQAEPVNVRFDDTIELVGYDIERQTSLSPTIDVTLYWRTEEYVTRPWTVFRHLMVNEDLVAQLDSQPVSGQWPATCWKPGEVIADRQVIPLDGQTLDEGTLMVGLYDAQSGRRLSVTETDRASCRARPEYAGLEHVAHHAVTIPLGSGE